MDGKQHEIHFVLVYEFPFYGQTSNQITQYMRNRLMRLSRKRHELFIYDYNSDQTNPQGPISGVNRISRGGSWFDGARCRSSQRDGNESTSVRNNITGLRLCLSE